MNSEPTYELMPTPSRSAARIGDYVDVVRRRWKLAVLLTFICTMIAAGWTLIAPHEYAASGTLMPPETGQRGGLNFVSLVQSGGLDLGSLTGGKGSSNVFQEILMSRTLADSLIDRLNLVERMDLPDDPLMAAQIVQGTLGADVRKSGVIEVMAVVGTGYMPDDEEIDEARALSAELVNEAMALLDLLNREKSTSSARNTRQFLERVIVQKKEELDEALGRLANFQKVNKALALDKQIEASVSGLAEIQAKIQGLEIRLAALRQELNPDAAEVEALESQLSELRSQQSRMSGTDVLGMSVQQAPEIAKEYAKLRLDVEVATQVYTSLESQFHSEQVQELKDIPTVSIFDEGRPPRFRASPRRTFTVLVAAGVSFALSIVLIVLLELYQREFRQHLRRRREERRSGIRTDAPGRTELHEADRVD